MQRRRFLTTSGLIAGAGLVSRVLPLTASAFTPSAGLFTPIRRGTGRFESRGGTIGWLINNDAVVAVDSQFPESAAVCRDGLNERSGRTIDLLINSHHHGDHTGGNGILGANAEHIVAHNNVPLLQRMQAGQRGLLDEQTYADVTFAESWSQDVGDETINLHYFGPAHTGGDIIIHFEKADVVHMGDLVFNHLHASIDLGAGADTANWMVLLERVYDMFTDNTVFVFGHANPANGVLGRRDDVLMMRDYLSAIRDVVQVGIQSGRTSEQIVEAGLEGFESHRIGGSDEGIKRNIATIYEEMTTVQE